MFLKTIAASLLFSFTVSAGAAVIDCQSTTESDHRHFLRITEIADITTHVSHSDLETQVLQVRVDLRSTLRNRVVNQRSFETVATVEGNQYKVSAPRTQGLNFQMNLKNLNQAKLDLITPGGVYNIRMSCVAK